MDITLSGLLRAAYECARGVRWKASVARWTAPHAIVPNCMRLLHELQAAAYRLSGYTVFHVTEPKPRLIRAPRLRDRIVQRALCNAGLYDDLTRDAIHDNCACQLGKGTKFARDRLTCFLQRHYRKHGTDGWVLQLDIRRFFDSLPHDRLHALVDAKVRPSMRACVHMTIDSFPGGVGIGLGSQISQLLAVAYLSPMDHVIKERFHIRHYIRYSDDMVFVHHDRAALAGIRSAVAGMLADLGLRLNPKSSLRPLGHGIRFLGFRFMLADTGKVVRRPCPGSFFRMRKRIGRLARNPLATQEALLHAFASWKAHVEQGNSWLIIRKAYQWTRSLSFRLRRSRPSIAAAQPKPRPI